VFTPTHLFSEKTLNSFYFVNLYWFNWRPNVVTVFHKWSYIDSKKINHWSGVAANKRTQKQGTTRACLGHQSSILHLIRLFQFNCNIYRTKCLIYIEKLKWHRIYLCIQSRNTFKFLSHLQKCWWPVFSKRGATRGTPPQYLKFP